MKNLIDIIKKSLLDSNNLYKTIVKGLENEVACDENFLLRSKIYKSKYRFAFRPTKFVLINQNFILNFIFRLVSPGLAIIMFILKVTQAFLFFTRGNFIEIEKPKKIFLQFSYQTASFIEDESVFSVKNKLWDVDYFGNYVNRLSRFKSILISCLFFIRLVGGLRFSVIINSFDLNNLVLFSFFLRRFEAVSYIGTFHYDRWALLTSELAGESLTIYQHGDVTELYDVPNKIQKLNRLYCFSDSQGKIWKENILDCNLQKFEFYIKNRPLVLKESLGKIDTLLIQCPGFEKLECEYLNNLPQNESIIAVKFHPLYGVPKAYDRISKEKVLFLTKPGEYPDANKIIAFGDSSLSNQYRQIGFVVESLSENS